MKSLVLWNGKFRKIKERGGERKWKRGEEKEYVIYRLRFISVYKENLFVRNIGINKSIWVWDEC